MIGVIGGTGLQAIESFVVEHRREVTTPYGKPSAPIVLGQISGNKIAFLPRHGVRHERLPTDINFRANIWALKRVGVRQIVSVSATGSLVRELAPGSLALVDQYFDWTKGVRKGTYFGKGLVGHVSTANAACPDLSRNVALAGSAVGVPIRTGATYACIEGPRFGTRAESFFLKSVGATVVGMTNVPEVFLAREAGLCYCTLAVVTDYDCWLNDPLEVVSSDKVAARFAQALGDVQSVVKALVSQSDVGNGCECRSAIGQSLLTSRDTLSAEAKQRLAFLEA